MTNQVAKIVGPVGVLMTLAMPAASLAAQGAAPAATPQETLIDGLYVTAINGQTKAQEGQDEYECHNWAAGQTGFDSSLPGGGVPDSQNAIRRSQYQRAMTACLEARGYSVRRAASAPLVTPAPAAPPPPVVLPAPIMVREQPQLAPRLSYHPFDVQIDGGYSLAVGNTNNDLHGGGDGGLGFAWFPSSLLPFGVRVDGRYASFGAKNELLNSGSGGFTRGHESIYGGDADLQLNLEHGAHARFYLFGGAGEYRVHTDLRQISIEQGTVCTPFGSFCGPGYFPAVTAREDHTTYWHLAWNAGAGWEIAIGDRSTFFIEGRYLQLGPDDRKLQLVPITLGFRF